MAVPSHMFGDSALPDDKALYAKLDHIKTADEYQINDSGDILQGNLERLRLIVENKSKRDAEEALQRQRNKVLEEKRLKEEEEQGTLEMQLAPAEVAMVEANAAPALQEEDPEPPIFHSACFRPIQVSACIVNKGRVPVGQ